MGRGREVIRGVNEGKGSWEGAKETGKGRGSGRGGGGEWEVKGRKLRREVGCIEW